METIIKFKAVDGVEFDEEKECIKYELLIDRVNSIMNTLPKHPNTTAFANGKGYLQHDKTAVKNAKISLLTICKEYINHKWIQQSIDDETAHPSWVGRLLAEADLRPLYLAWARFSCIDSNYKEWGQPYFALNPHQGEQKQLN